VHTYISFKDDNLSKISRKILEYLQEQIVYIFLHCFLVAVSEEHFSPGVEVEMG
jgi:hypothetical protein